MYSKVSDKAVRNVNALDALRRRSARLDAAQPQTALAADAVACLFGRLVLGHSGAMVQDLRQEAESFGNDGTLRVVGDQANRQAVVANVAAVRSLADLPQLTLKAFLARVIEFGGVVQHQAPRPGISAIRRRVSSAWACISISWVTLSQFIRR